MPTNARVAVLRPGSISLSVEEVKLPDPASGQVLVRNLGSGICYSQLHEMHAERTQTHLLGHESCGIVEATGTDVTDVAVGDAVSVTWVAKPGVGSPWRAGATLPGGEYATTDEMVFTWGTHSLVDARYAVPIPVESASDVAAVLGCAVMTGVGAVMRTAAVPSGASVAVWGAGGVGLSAIVAARLSRAATIVAVDVAQEKLDLARDFGATHVVNATTTDPVAAIHDITARDGLPPGADYVIDCVASEATLEAGLLAARRGVTGRLRGGQLVVVGVPKPGVAVSARELLIGHKTATASLGGRPEVEIPELADWVARGEIDLAALVTDRYELDDINQAVADLAAGHIRGRAILSFDKRRSP